MIVIIGAGPAGLYAGIKLALKRADVIIVDPRAGSYTRPGRLGAAVFRKAEEGIGKPFWTGLGEGHIKELERNLYTEALLLGIDIQNKRFVRLYADETSPGVVVIDDTTGLEERIPADHVLDCTGTRRDVIRNVNELIAESPLKLSTFTELPVSTHMIANVRIPYEDFVLLSKTISESTYFPPSLTDETYARLILELRSFGWNELKFPRCHGAYIGKNKACLYLQTPKGLPKESYDAWLNLVLRCYLLSGRYEHLPVSKKYEYKPRVITFTVTSQALDHVAYRGLNLPMVVALGDAQIDPYFTLGHGILYGLDRINAFLEQLAIHDGKISRFNPEAYLALIKPSLDKHKEAIIAEAHRQGLSFVTALDHGKAKLSSAMAYLRPDEHGLITLILMDLEVRAAYGLARSYEARGEHSKALSTANRALDLYKDCIPGIPLIPLESILWLMVKNFEKECFSLLLMGKDVKASNLHRAFSKMIVIYKPFLSPTLLSQVETTAAEIKTYLTPPEEDTSPTAPTSGHSITPTLVDAPKLRVDETDEEIILIPRSEACLDLTATPAKASSIGIFKPPVPTRTPRRNYKNTHCAMF